MSLDTEQLRATVQDLMPGVRTDLERLVRIPSVHFPDYDLDPVRECANACAELFRAAGAQVELVDTSTGAPTVVATVPGPAGAPTVLLYSHYDVQPGSDPAKWDSPAFEPTLRDGRLYGRGAADDKSGVVTHLACVRAFGGTPPVTLRIYLEGEEEYGGDFEEWPTTRPEMFAGVAAAVVNDMGPVELGLPTFTTALRGIVSGEVTVRTLREPVHSGVAGGPIPDALMVLIKTLATLQDDRGDCAVDGIPGSDWPGAEVPEETFRELSGVLPGVPLIGSGSVASHLVSRPSVNVLGIDAPEVATAPNALVPVARAKVSVRIPANVNSAEATTALQRHLEAHAPWGVSIEFQADPPANGTEIPVGGPAYTAFAQGMRDAYGVEPTQQGLGGSVPFVANLLSAFPDLEVLGIGAQDPLARIHAPNESIDLAELERSILAQVLFLASYGDSRVPPRSLKPTTPVPETNHPGP